MFFKSFFIWSSDRSVADPLPRMPLHDDVRPVEELLPSYFPDLFGPSIEHQCRYRTHLADFIAAELQQRTTQGLAGEASEYSLFTHFLQSFVALLSRHPQKAAESFDFWKPAPGSTTHETSTSSTSQLLSAIVDQVAAVSLSTKPPSASPAPAPSPLPPPAEVRSMFKL